MTDTNWMLHDGAYRAVIWPFRSREHAEAWQEEFCLSGFRAAPMSGEGPESQAPSASPAGADRLTVGGS